MSTCVLWPTETSTFWRVTVAKPGIATVTEYSPGATLRNRKRPFASAVAVRGAAGPISVTRPPGIGDSRLVDQSSVDIAGVRLSDER